MAGQAPRWTVRRRYRHILKTLTRHGLGYSLAHVGLGGLIPFHRGLAGHAPQPAPYTRPQHLRLALQELSRLQAEVPPVPFADLAGVLAVDLFILRRLARRSPPPVS